MLAYIHTCGRPAFLMTYRLEPYAKAKSDGVLHTNYQPVQPYSIMLCDSCGKMIQSLDSDNLRTMI